MNVYLENNKLYVKTANNLIYAVDSFEPFHGMSYNKLHLQLVAGVDYLNEDSDVQGWCPASNFVEDMQEEWVLQHFMEEGMKEALTENDYIILDKLPFDPDNIIK